MNRLLRVLLPVCAIAICRCVYAQVPRDVAVELEAKIEGKNFTISWLSDSRATGYQINRRNAGASAWGAAKSLPGTAMSYTDTTIVPGQLYEFRVRKSIKIGNDSYAWGYIYGGVDILHANYQGALVLVVDDTFAPDLSAELLRLEDDLANEGWTVKRIDVKRSWSPPQVKDLIFNLFNQDPSNTKAVLLFGHVPVPYSGMIVPDGHINNHLAPWPADGYYGDDAEWYDEIDYDTMLVLSDGQGGYDTTIVPKANRNLAGDGRFDPSEFPDDIDLMVGRIDLWNMTAFAKDEKELLRQYLDKDHAYRTGALTAPPRALIDDGFVYFGGEAFASSAWRAFPQLVGRDSIKDNLSDAAIDWFPVLEKEPYLWAYGCGGGNFTGAGGIGSTTDFATRGSKAIFTMLFGSYFGDWNVTNNFLRAPLATEYGLSCAWSGRPYWYFHPMAIGMSLGFCAKLTQNNFSSYVSGPTNPRSIHVALMGDPTLRMNPIAPPANLAIAAQGLNRVSLDWRASSDASIDGYNIYKAHTEQGPFYLSNAIPVTETSYLDTLPFLGKNVYMVHAVRKEITPAGSYYNLSPAARGIVDSVLSGVAEAMETSASLAAMETSAGTEFLLTMPKQAHVNLALYDALGKLITSFDDRMLSPGTFRYTWQSDEKRRHADGVYFAVANIGGKTMSYKIINAW